MMRHVPFNTLGLTHLEAIAHSLLAAPEEVRPDDILKNAQLGATQFYEWDCGLIGCSKRGNRLVLDVFSCLPGISMEACRSLATDLKKLAADWLCDTIETTVFDPHFASVIQHLGGRVEQWVLTMPVEPEHG